MHMRPRHWTDLNGDRPEDGKNKNKDRSATIKGGPGPVSFSAQVAYLLHCIGCIVGFDCVCLCTVCPAVHTSSPFVQCTDPCGH